MKSQFTLLVMAAVALQTAVAVPAAFADDSRHERHEARREERRADDAHADAIKNDLNGHPIRAELNERHALKEERRADRHYAESRY